MLTFYFSIPDFFHTIVFSFHQLAGVDNNKIVPIFIQSLLTDFSVWSIELPANTPRMRKRIKIKPSTCLITVHVLYSLAPALPRDQSMAMDLQTLVQALANTLDQSLGKQAEASNRKPSSVLIHWLTPYRISYITIMIPEIIPDIMVNTS